ncbi:MAG: urease accessory protein UreD [Betaproteobacteria bacterium]|nr:urease accessory protein UreD [Betaproteobacteria bacterium]MDE2622562.1 urease accessory protein UreD [Betaproteobacteria bacterium]
MQEVEKGWHASLSLAYDRAGLGTVLRHKSHHGPLRVQKVLYPEGDGVCHTLLLHPPGGIVGGDQLQVQAYLGEKSHVLFTNPGANKWYRSEHRQACQQVRLHVGPQAALEWLPQETIFFDGCQAQMAMEVELEPGAAMVGWDILCFGRRHSGEAYSQGRARTSLSIRRQGSLVLLDRARFEAQEPIMKSLTGLDGHTVMGTLVACGEGLTKEVLADCRSIQAGDQDRTGITLMDGIFIARILGDSSETAKLWFTALWHALRPTLMGRPAENPRIWRT